MRARTGARTENANRKGPLLALTTLSTGLATATALVAAPSMAASMAVSPAAPADGVDGRGAGVPQPPVPVAADGAQPASAGTDTDVRELAVPRVRPAERAVPQQRGAGAGASGE